MKWAAMLVLLATAISSGCWRPYYGHTYAQPVYSQPSPYQQGQTYQAAPAVQAQPAYVQPQPQVVQQPCVPCRPVYCPPACTPCY